MMIKIWTNYFEDKEKLFKFTLQEFGDGKELFLQFIHDGLVFYDEENQGEKFFYGSTHKKDTADIIFKSCYQLGFKFQVKIDSEHSDDLSIFIDNLGLTQVLIKNTAPGISIFEF